MKTQIKIIIAAVIALLYVASMISFASALIVDADYIKIFPGDEASISIEVENNENFDIEKVSVGIDLSGLPFTSIGSSEKDLDDLDEDDDDSATFRIKANNDAAPGSYEIPYTVRAVEDGNEDNKITKNGTFGITIGAETELSFDTVVEKNVVGEQGQISIKIINSGLGSIGFVNVRIANVNGFEILGSSQEYVGEVDSDDFELATFDVKFLKETASVGAVVTYKDFDNIQQTEVVNLPIKVYSREKALELRIIKKNNTGLYTGIVIALILIWIIYRTLRKRAKRKQREAEKNGR